LRNYLGVEFWAVGQRISEANWGKDKQAPIMELNEFLDEMDWEYYSLKAHFKKVFKPKE